MTQIVDIDKIARELANGMTLEQLRAQQLGQASKGSVPQLSPTVPQNERAANYLKNLFDERPKLDGVMMGRKVVQEMDFEVARKKVWALFQIRAAHLSDIENRDFAWTFTDVESAIVRNMTKYFVNDGSCDWPLSKGLFLYGLPGTGKTEFIRIFERFTRENDLSKRFEFTSMSDTYVKSKSEKDFDPVTTNLQFDRCFDEFGRYTGAVLRYGDPLDINEAIVEARYERAKRYGQISHFIANMAPNEAEKAFSPMIFDRVRSMCSGVFFQGKSKR